MPKSPANKGASKKSALAAKAKSPPPDALGAAEAFDAFLPAAKAIDAKNVRVMRADPALARHNITVGLAAVLPHESTLGALPAPFDLEQLKSLDALSLCRPAWCCTSGHSLAENHLEDALARRGAA